MSINMPTLPSRITAARDGAGDEAYLSQTRCVDWLLDCRAVVDRPALRELIDEALVEISRVRLVTGEHFRSMLDHLELALAVDSAFDHLELKAA